MKKRGQAQIITTVLIILLVLAAIVIIWNVINRAVSESSEDVNIETFTTQIGVEEIAIQSSTQEVIVQVKKGTGKGDITELKFIFYNMDGTNKIISRNDNLPLELETKTFTFSNTGRNLPYPINEISKVSVVPVFGDKLGMEVEGPKPSRDCTPYAGQESEETDCLDGFDNDCDGYFDNEDYDCITAPSNPNLISWWEFEEDKTGGETTPDSVGGNHGTLFRDAFISDEELVLDGDEDYVGITRGIGSGQMDELTISFWAKANDLTSPGNLAFLGSGDGWFYGMKNFIIAPDGYGTKKLRFVLNMNWGGPDDISSLDYVLRENAWQHIAISFESGTVKMYIDGEEKAVQNNGVMGSNSVNLLEDTTIGRNYDKFFEGRIDNIMIFNKALSEDEIQAIFEAQNKG